MFEEVRVPAVWPITRCGDSGNGRLDVWTYSDGNSAHRSPAVEYDGTEYAALPVDYALSAIMLCCNVFRKPTSSSFNRRRHWVVLR